MDVRSDFSLDLQLEYVHKQAASDEVKRAVTSVLQHMRTGRGGHRRGGKALVQLLTDPTPDNSSRRWPVIRVIMMQRGQDFKTLGCGTWVRVG